MKNIKHKSKIVIQSLFIISSFLSTPLLADDHKNTDTRTTLDLNSSQGSYVLKEMRDFLNSVQKITYAISENDLKMAAKYARKVGRAAQGGAPAGLGKKLPMAFKKLGRDTHQKFDQLALDAEEFEDNNQALSQLSSLMNNCISCHASYQINLIK